MVFIARYMDLFWNFSSVYLIVMKLIFISSTLYIIYLIAVQYSAKYDKKNDHLPTYYVIIPCIILALIVNQKFTVWEVRHIVLMVETTQRTRHFRFYARLLIYSSRSLGTFSIYLEAVAIIPQLMLLTKTGSVDTITSHYVFCLGGYRALYILNWVWRYAKWPLAAHKLSLLMALSQILYGAPLQAVDRLGSGSCTNRAVLRLFLPLHQKVRLHLMRILSNNTA